MFRQTSYLLIESIFCHHDMFNWQCLIVLSLNFSISKFRKYPNWWKYFRLHICNYSSLSQTHSLRNWPEMPDVIITKRGALLQLAVFAAKNSFQEASTWSKHCQITMRLSRMIRETSQSKKTERFDRSQASLLRCMTSIYVACVLTRYSKCRWTSSVHFS